MEPEMNHQQALNAEETTQPDEALLQAARHCLQEYLRDLGLSDRKLIEKMAADCVSRAAAHRVPRDSASKLKQRSLQEMLGMLDQMLQLVLGNSIRNDQATMNASRAAFLLGLPKNMLENCLRGMEENDGEALAAMLRKSMPIPTPPETPAHMTAQKLKFFLFKSTS